MKERLLFWLMCCGEFLGFLFGSFDGGIICLICFVTLDILTGIIKGAAKHKLSSKTMYKGLFKKLGIFIVIAVSNILEAQILKTNNVLRLAVIIYYIGNEGISICENLVAIGIPLPKRLVDLLDEMSKDKEEV